MIIRCYLQDQSVVDLLDAVDLVALAIQEDQAYFRFYNTDTVSLGNLYFSDVLISITLSGNSFDGLFRVNRIGSDAKFTSMYLHKIDTAQANIFHAVSRHRSN
jgi:hypothetical protein